MSLPFFIEEPGLELPLSLYAYESELASLYLSQGLPIAGTDEVGVGCLAGPLVAAAVILPRTPEIEFLNDSKKLSRVKRESLNQIIHALAVSISIVEISVAQIDEINIYQSAILGMRQAVCSLSVAPAFVLVDARTLIKLPCPQKSIIKGDARCASIAAASIVAKVYRDRLMKTYHEQYPMYGFASHQGYGTKAHLEALKKYGPTPYHRTSYAPVAEILQRTGKKSNEQLSLPLDFC